MSYIININTYRRDEVDLTVLENVFDEPIQRMFFLTNLKKDSIRGGNTTTNSYEGIICIKGSCKVNVIRDNVLNKYFLENQNTCLIIEPYDWHEIYQFEEDSILLAFSNMKYDDIIFL
jgi:hypothetical protein